MAHKPNIKPKDENAPIGPVDQSQLVLYASKNTSLSACDLAVLAEITDRYLKLKGVTYPTGLTHLVRETGRSHSSVQDSVRRLLSFKYISIKVEGKGTRGTEYDVNFDWVRQVADRIRQAKADRTDAKKSRRKKSASVPADHTTTKNNLVYRNSTPLRDLVGVPSGTLNTLGYRDSGTQTYWGTNSTPSTVAKNPHSGLGASAVSAPFDEDDEDEPYVDEICEIDHAELVIDEGTKTLVYHLIEPGTTNGTDEGVPFGKLKFIVEDDDPKKQAYGQSELGKFLRVFGKEDVGELDELDFFQFILTAEGDFLPVPGYGGTMGAHSSFTRTEAARAAGMSPPVDKDVTIYSVTPNRGGQFEVELLPDDCDAPPIKLMLNHLGGI